MSILTKAQAEAVYSAICALNNVEGSFDKVKFGGVGNVYVKLQQHSVSVYQYYRVREEFPSQAAFAAAYGLN